MTPAKCTEGDLSLQGSFSSPARVASTVKGRQALRSYEEALVYLSFFVWDLEGFPMTEH